MARAGDIGVGVEAALLPHDRPDEAGRERFCPLRDADLAWIGRGVGAIPCPARVGVGCRREEGRRNGLRDLVAPSRAGELPVDAAQGLDGSAGGAARHGALPFVERGFGVGVEADPLQEIGGGRQRRMKWRGRVGVRIRRIDRGWQWSTGLGKAGSGDARGPRKRMVARDLRPKGYRVIPIAVAEGGQRRHVRHAAVGDRVRDDVVPQAFECGARSLRVDAEELAQTAVAAGVALVSARRVGAQVDVEAAGADLPLGVEHLEVGHEEGRVVGVRRLGVAPRDVLVRADGLLVAVDAGEGARGVKRVLRGVGSSRVGALRQGLGGLAAPPACAKEDVAAGAHALEVADLVGVRGRGGEVDGVKGIVRPPGVRERPGSRHELYGGQRVPRVDVREQRDAVDWRGVGSRRGQPTRVRSLVVAGRLAGQTHPKGTRLRLLGVRVVGAPDGSVRSEACRRIRAGLLECARGVELRSGVASGREPLGGFVEGTRGELGGGSGASDVLREQRKPALETVEERDGRGRVVLGPERRGRARNALPDEPSPVPGGHRGAATQRPTAPPARGSAKGPRPTRHPWLSHRRHPTHRATAAKERREDHARPPATPRCGRTRARPPRRARGYAQTWKPPPPFQPNARLTPVTSTPSTTRRSRGRQSVST